MSHMPPKNRTIQIPAGGWKESTYYAVLVSWNPQNPKHKAIFYSGFLNGPDGGPGGYNVVWNPTYDQLHPLFLAEELERGGSKAEVWSAKYPFGIDKVHYLQVMGEIPALAEDDVAREDR